MSCDNCMKHRPDCPSGDSFTCPECKQKYVKAGVGPGTYWETEEDQIKGIEECNKKFDENGNFIVTVFQTHTPYWPDV